MRKGLIQNSTITSSIDRVIFAYEEIIQNTLPEECRGSGSPMIKVSEHGRHVMSSSPVPLKIHRVGQRCTLNLSRVEASSRWCDS
ncbi:hypothetical protein TNCV_4090281 [Trichonephila clavipes]|uniref:Uncharacterized protein n=1 Tax=Trichonephila clavipes TaxID=2585209 RepID=A0A8X6S5M0_TRICX|nr:hypothetical protein TNCV_4090281 [Trichonephila clavipes]